MKIFIYIFKRIIMQVWKVGRKHLISRPSIAPFIIRYHEHWLILQFSRRFEKSILEKYYLASFPCHKFCEVPSEYGSMIYPPCRSIEVLGGKSILSNGTIHFPFFFCFSYTKGRLMFSSWNKKVGKGIIHWEIWSWAIIIWPLRMWLSPSYLKN